MVLVVIVCCSRGGGSRGLVDASSGPVVVLWTCMWFFRPGSRRHPVGSVSDITDLSLQSTAPTHQVC